MLSKLRKILLKNWYDDTFFQQISKISYRTFKSWRLKMKGWSQKIVLSPALCLSWPRRPQLPKRNSNNSSNNNNNKVHLEPWCQVDPIMGANDADKHFDQKIHQEMQSLNFYFFLSKYMFKTSVLIQDSKSK